MAGSWTGVPCQSDYLEYRASATPIGVATVADLSQANAFLKIDYYGAETVRPGAILELLSLVPNEQSRARAPLRRFVRIISVDSEKLNISDGSKVDLTLFVKDQLSSIVREQGYYIRE